MKCGANIRSSSGQASTTFGPPWWPAKVIGLLSKRQSHGINTEFGMDLNGSLLGLEPR